MERRPFPALALAALISCALVPSRAEAHCDALDGPVVRDARVALDTGSLDPALKWVGPEEEGELREAFRQARAARALGGPAREVADRFFLEAVVRLHRQGEGAAFTGLKPAGRIDPGISAADEALARGEVDPLLRRITAEAERGVRERFTRAREAQARSEESVALGREAVAAYVDYVHHVEGLLQAAGGGPEHQAAHEER